MDRRTRDTSKSVVRCVCVGPFVPRCRIQRYSSVSSREGPTPGSEEGDGSSLTVQHAPDPSCPPKLRHTSPSTTWDPVTVRMSTGSVVSNPSVWGTGRLQSRSGRPGDQSLADGSHGVPVSPDLGPRQVGLPSPSRLLFDGVRGLGGGPGPTRATRERGRSGPYQGGPSQCPVTPILYPGEGVEGPRRLPQGARTNDEGLDWGSGSGRRVGGARSGTAGRHLRQEGSRSPKATEALSLGVWGPGVGVGPESRVGRGGGTGVGRGRGPEHRKGPNPPVATEVPSGPRGSCLSPADGTYAFLGGRSGRSHPKKVGCS